MIRIVASGVVRDGCRTEFLRLAERLVAASRAEAGNVSYGLYASADAPNASPFWRNGRMKRRSKRTTPRPISPRFVPRWAHF